MTRLDSSARDYAIALLAPTGDLCTLDALESVERLDGLECWAAVNRALGYLNVDDPHTHLRILRARVALYLRLMRRVEAWEAEGCLWSGWAAPGWVFTRKGVPRSEPARMQWTPWRPLWTSAPPHAPGVTARMRRGMAEDGRETPQKVTT